MHLEEELFIPGGGTATTPDGEVTVGCEVAYPYEAKIGFSLVSGEAFNPQTLKPSQSHRVDSNGRSYRILLLATDYEGVRVRVSRAALKETKAESPGGVRVC